MGKGRELKGQRGRKVEEVRSGEGNAEIRRREWAKRRKKKIENSEKAEEGLRKTERLQVDDENEV